MSQAEQQHTGGSLQGPPSNSSVSRPPPAYSRTSSRTVQAQTVAPRAPDGAGPSSSSGAPPPSYESVVGSSGKAGPSTSTQNKSAPGSGSKDEDGEKYICLDPDLPGMHDGPLRVLFAPDNTIPAARRTYWR
ncbi:unnamed protein product [Peniophora sp. CBMAI 1063]|nr:unnamed protein product [Peniophora sp. CBMAI 1063]